MNSNAIRKRLVSVITFVVILGFCRSIPAEDRSVQQGSDRGPQLTQAQQRKIQLAAKPAKKKGAAKRNKRQERKELAEQQRARRLWLLLAICGISATLNVIVLVAAKRSATENLETIPVDLPNGLVEIPKTPMEMRGASHCDAWLSHHNPDRIRIGHPNLRSVGCGGSALMIAAACSFLLIRMFPSGKPDVLDWVLYVIGAIVGGLVAVFCGFFAVAFLVDDRRFRFDIPSRTIHRGLLGLRTSWSFDDVTALQLLPYDSYCELNLVFAGDVNQRANVTCHGDVMWTWHAARILASALLVPLVDQYSRRNRPRVILPDEFDGLPAERRTASSLRGYVAASSLNVTTSNTVNRSIRQRDSDCLIIHRGLGEIVTAILILVFGVIAGVAVNFFVMGDWINADAERLRNGNITAAAWSVLMCGYLWRLSRWRVIIDRLENRIIYGPGWERQVRPLEEIVAVQLIPGPTMTMSQSGRVYRTMQLNLVFDDPPLPRLNLSCHADAEWTRDAGNQVAKFLKVPLLDQCRRRRPSEEIETPDPKRSKWTINDCVREGKLSSLRKMLDKGSEPDERDHIGYTPLLWAAEIGQTEIVEELLDRGADLHARANNGTTPLLAAAIHQRQAAVEQLCDAGAEVDLYVACAMGDLPQVKQFLETNAFNINEQLEGGDTPLHMAVYGGEPAVVQELLSHGADTTLENQWKKTPLDLARSEEVEKDPQIIELLESSW